MKEGWSSAYKWMVSSVWADCINISTLANQTFPYIRRGKEECTSHGLGNIMLSKSVSKTRPSMRSSVIEMIKDQMAGNPKRIIYIIQICRHMIIIFRWKDRYWDLKFLEWKSLIFEIEMRECRTTKQHRIAC